MLKLQSAAIGIVFNKEKTQILLVKRNDVPIWVLPGGGIDPDETSKQAAIREIREETGLDVIIERQSGDYYPINRLSSHTSVYVCVPCEPIPKKYPLSSETADCGFFSIEELPPTLFFLHRDWICDALTSNEVHKRPIDQITYWGLVKYAWQHPFLLFRFLCTRCKVLWEK